jgi:UDP-N-acetylenolpyruvoylglucosamine reductase
MQSIESWDFYFRKKEVWQTAVDMSRQHAETGLTILACIPGSPGGLCV